MNVLKYLKNNILFFDGAMGTVLQSHGLKAGECSEEWNLTHPEIIREVHMEYYEAGCNVICTNTFGANSLKYDDKTLDRIFNAAFENARFAKECSLGKQEKYIALDIGPSGKLLKPYGDFAFETAVQLFAKQVKLGVKYGADLILIETMNDGYETKAALLAAKENCNLPVFVSNAYGTDSKLMTGASPAVMATMLESMGADAIGANCSFGPDKLTGVIDELLENCSVPVFFKPNAGLPQEIEGKTIYNTDADTFAFSVAKTIKKGVKIAGGCCGTDKTYIAALVNACKKIRPVKTKFENKTAICSSLKVVSFGENPVIIGERINPTGKPRFKQAIRENDINYILQEALSEQQAGSDVLDINVGLPDTDEKQMLTSVVESVQAVCDLPLQIDTSDVNAMEAALRVYNGKALINSVNGKAESMRNVFPIAKKYGGAIICLTLDENGIPDTAEGRLKIAKKIIRTAQKYGIDKSQLIFDPLAMAVSADANAAKITLDAIKLITEKTGCNTSLGVSNVSFGLPERDTINGAFLTVALANGLSAAIINPCSKAMMKSYYTYLLLCGKDKNCAKYIGIADGSSQPQILNTSDITLQDAILRGLKQECSLLTEKLLKELSPMQIINEMVIPALDEVGKLYEEKKAYLPQLLISAECAEAAFEKIKQNYPASSENKKCPFVIATVHGDIHDIGKNIVKLLLESYGFSVTDLGKDVHEQIVVDAVKHLHAPIAGLSALMTTTVPAMEKTVQLLRKEAPWCKVVVGGAVLNEEYAERIGADKYAKDAMETVRYAEKINAELENATQTENRTKETTFDTII